MKNSFVKNQFPSHNRFGILVLDTVFFCVVLLPIHSCLYSFDVVKSLELEIQDERGEFLFLKIWWKYVRNNQQKKSE